MEADNLAPSRDTSMRVLPVRGDCILVELADLGEALALFDALQGNPVDGVWEIIPAARTLLIVFDPGEISVELLTLKVASLSGGERKAASGPLVEIPVRYDGEDLPHVAEMLNMSVEDVVRLHGESEYLVAFTGFAPGFAYLAGGDPRLTVPRRKSPALSCRPDRLGLLANSAVFIRRRAPAAGS